VNATAQRIAASMLAIASTLGSTACVSFTYERHVAFEPIPDAAVSTLVIGTSTLGDALDRMGAPLYVWEGVDGAVVLGYGFENQREVGINVSVPVIDRQSASFNYDDVAKRLEGYVLVFDRDLKLHIVRRGLLRDLALATRSRPSFEE